MMNFRIGLISDTHGLVRPEALAALDGCDHILHAGDIHTPDVLPKLRQLAPITAVRGNNDRGEWVRTLPEFEIVDIAGINVYLRHDESELDIDPAGAGIRVVVFGHSHRPLIEVREGVLHVNPGSAGPRRFRLPVTVGELLVSGNEVSARIIELQA